VRASPRVDLFAAAALELATDGTRTWSRAAGAKVVLASPVAWLALETELAVELAPRAPMSAVVNVVIDY
jgi:hypothetical protein